MPLATETKNIPQGVWKGYSPCWDGEQTTSSLGSMKKAGNDGQRPLNPSTSHIPATEPGK